MNNLYRAFPTHAVIDGRKRRLNPGFGRVLEALDVYRREDWAQAQKDAYVAWLLVRGRVRHPSEAAQIALETILGVQESGGGDPVIDFTQDAATIYAAFWQAYGIDLQAVRDSLHWQAFAALLGALPDNTRLSQIVGVRTAEVPAATKHNAATIQKLMRAKSIYGLKKTEAQRQVDFQTGLAKLAAWMMAAAEGGENNG